MRQLRSAGPRRALAHQCRQCRRHWALRLVEHPAGTVVLCRYCGCLHTAAAGRVPLRSVTDGDVRAASG